MSVARMVGQWNLAQPITSKNIRSLFHLVAWWNNASSLHYVTTIFSSQSLSCCRSQLVIISTMVMKLLNLYLYALYVSTTILYSLLPTISAISQTLSSWYLLLLILPFFIHILYLYIFSISLYTMFLLLFVSLCGAMAASSRLNNDIGGGTAARRHHRGTSMAKDVWLRDNLANLEGT